MSIRKKLRKLAGAVLTLGLVFTLSAPQAVLADSQKVVTLGANLSDAQKQSILKYFGVTEDSVQIIYVTNQDERDRLASYVPLEQIGTRTFSCAYVQPTTKGGIQVKTANLNWVTSNMIAASLSTSGVKNCHVVAASPFEVSGTGALTGVLMAYEAATGESLSESKKEAAAQEIVTTGQVADTVGQAQATKIINDVKIKIIEDGLSKDDEAKIRQIVEDAVKKAMKDQASVDQMVVDTFMDEEEEYNAEDVLGSEEIEALVQLGEVIAEQQYDIEDVKETLSRVEENVNNLIGLIPDEEEEEEFDFEEEEEDDALDDDSILMNTDDTALGDGVIIDATDDAAVQQTESDAQDAADDDELPFAITTEDNANFDDSGDADDGQTEEFSWNDDADEDEITWNETVDTFGGDETDDTDEAYTDDAADDWQNTEDTDEFDVTDAEDETNAADEADEGDEADAAEEALAAEYTFAAGGGTPSFGPVSLAFYTNGSLAPVSGSVVIEDMSGNRVAEINLADDENWGIVSADSDTLGKLGWSKANEIHVMTGGLSLSDDQYMVSADIVFAECDEDGDIIEGNESEAIYEEAVFNYYSSGIGVSGDTAGEYSRGSSLTLAVGFPEEAAFAEVSSSKPEVADADEAEIYSNEDSIARTSVYLADYGKATITVTYYSEDGEEVGEDSILIPVLK